MMKQETYIELTHAMMFAIAQSDLTIPQAASVMFSCAQPDTTEELLDVTKEVRNRLTDWPHASRGKLIAVECVRITFQCNNIHGPCDRGQHQVMMARIMGNNQWRPHDVVSSIDFDNVVLEVIQEQHADPTQKFRATSSKIGGSSLMGAFAEMFANQPEDQIDRKIEDFRAELDSLFPTTKKGGRP
jgi:hypothetical protein